MKKKQELKERIFNHISKGENLSENTIDFLLSEFDVERKDIEMCCKLFVALYNINKSETMGITIDLKTYVEIEVDEFVTPNILSKKDYDVLHELLYLTRTSVEHRKLLIKHCNNLSDEEKRYVHITFDKDVSYIKRDADRNQKINDVFDFLKTMLKSKER